MSILEKIVEKKRCACNQQLSHISKDHLRITEGDIYEPKSFLKTLHQPGLALIAEIKKGSPSKGLIRSNYQPEDTASIYQAHGASCISILTEEDFFFGSPSHLQKIRPHIDIPILRKDFIVDERQIRESYDLQADAILLIVAVLSKKELHYFHQLAQGFGLTCLVEVHTETELMQALDLGFALIGINNRNLTTFETSIEHSLKLKDKLPSSVTTVSESGINSPDDCQALLDAGFDAILVGEALMKEDNQINAIQHLLQGCR